MRKPASMRSYEALGRIRLSRHFYMRDFLLSEIGIMHGIPNVPENPDLAIMAGRALCENLLDPLQETFGRIEIRSGYRAAAINAFGNKRSMSCAMNANDAEFGHHIWDLQPDGQIGAGATVVIPWFADQYAQGRDWRDLAWWIHDHLPFSYICVFPKLCAMNLAWSSAPRRKIKSYVAPKGTLMTPGTAPPVQRAACYADFPPLRGIAYPAPGAFPPLTRPPDLRS